MKTEPLLGAAAFGAVCIVFYNLFTTFLALHSSSLDGLSGGIHCLIGPAIAMGVGFLYAYLHGRKAPLTAGVGAKGGLAAGALAFAINGAVSILIAVVLGPQMFAGAWAASGFSDSLDMGTFNTLMLGGVLVGTCLGVGMNALISAVGGAIGATLLGSQPAGQSPPSALQR